ncbi:hypothetical protein WA158_008284 [Blastocystis sp. Blastoise]
MEAQIRGITSILLTSTKDKKTYVHGLKQLIEVDTADVTDEKIANIQIAEVVKDALDNYSDDSVVNQLSGGVVIRYVKYDSVAKKAHDYYILDKLISVFPTLEQENAATSVLSAIALLSLTKYDKDHACTEESLAFLQSIISKWYASEKVLQQFVILVMAHLSNTCTHSGFIKTALYDDIYKSISKFINNDKLFIGFVSCATSLTESDIGRLFLIQKKCVSVLSFILNQFIGNKDIALEANKIIFKLNLDPATREGSIRDGAIKVIGQTIMGCLQQNDLLGVATQTLRSLASVGKLVVDYMISDNTVAILVMCMLAYPAENLMIQHGLRILELLLIHGAPQTVVKLVIDEGIYKVFAEVLKNNENAEPLCKTCILLCQLESMKVYPSLIQDNYMSNELYSICVSLYSKFSKNDIVLIYISKFCSSLASNKNTYPILLQYDIIPAVLGIMSSYPHTDKCYAAASNLLWKLAVDKNARTKIIEQNGIQHILKLTQQYLNYKPVQLACLGTLNLLAENNREVCQSIRKVLGLQVIFSSMERGLKDVEINLQTASIITYMAALDEQCKETLLHKNIIPLYMKILSVNPTNPALTYSVVSSLLVLSYEPAGLEQLQSDPEYLYTLEDVRDSLPRDSVNLPVQSLIHRINATNNF